MKCTRIRKEWIPFLKAVGGGHNRIILAHMGGLKEQDMVREYLVGRDVYLDTAAVKLTLSREELMKTIRAHGIDKILFGTDNPWGDQEEYVELINGLPLTEEEKEKDFLRKCKEAVGDVVKVVQKCNQI